MPALPPEHPGCPNARRSRRPLPDPAAVRLCRIPDPAPPYDPDFSGAQPAAATDASEAASGSGPRGEADGGSGEGNGTRERNGGEHRTGGVVPPGWPSRFAQVLAETLAGSRPPAQMVPWTTEVARGQIQRLGPQLASVQRPKLRRVVTFQPSSGVLEMTVVVGFGPRVRALAVRLERSGQSRWLCTAVEAA